MEILLAFYAFLVLLLLIDIVQGDRYTKKEDEKKYFREDFDDEDTY